MRGCMRRAEAPRQPLSVLTRVHGAYRFTQVRAALRNAEPCDDAGRARTQQIAPESRFDSVAGGRCGRGMPTPSVSDPGTHRGCRTPLPLAHRHGAVAFLRGTSLGSWARRAASRALALGCAPALRVTGSQSQRPGARGASSVRAPPTSSIEPDIPCQTGHRISPSPPSRVERAHHPSMNHQ